MADSKPKVSDVLARLEALRARFTAATTAEAVAKSRFETAQTEATKAESELRALGIDPDKAEEQVAAMVAALDTEITAVDTRLTEALAQYRTIEEAFSKVGASA